MRIIFVPVKRIISGISLCGLINTSIIMKENLILKKYIILICSLNLLYSCNTRGVQEAQSNLNKKDISHEMLLERGESGSRIVFLTMEIILKDSIRGTYDIRKTDVKYAEGTVKKSSADEFGNEPQFIYCEILDANKKRQDMVKSVNPLYRVFEYTDEGSNEIKSKTIKAQTGEFTVRFNLNNQTKFITLYTSSDNTLKKIYHGQI